MVARARAPKPGEWLTALTEAGLEVKSARDACQVKGWLDTGCWALNWAISGRLQWGYPLGHTIEIFGDPSTGKSFLIARAIAMAQAAKGEGLLDDTEGAYGVAWMQALGIDTDRLAYRHSRTVKDHLETAQGFVKAYQAAGIQGPGILACDSLALLSTEHELEVRLDKPDMTKAKALRTFFRIVGHEFFDMPVVHMSTNHTIANIGDMFNKRTTPGGGGVKFQASVRLDMRAISKIKSKDGDGYDGVLCRVVVDKNRIVAPWKETRLAIPFHQPISRGSGLIDLLIRLGVLEARGQFLFYQGRKVGRHYEDKKHFLKQDEQAESLLDQVPELLDTVDAQIEAGTLASPTAAVEEQVAAEEDEE